MPAFRPPEQALACPSFPSRVRPLQSSGPQITTGFEGCRLGDSRAREGDPLASRKRDLLMVEVTPVEQPRRSILKLSLGISVAMFVAVVGAVVFSGASAEAATCTLTSTAPTTQWSDTTKWAP